MDKEILEGNKLIAEFMGGVIKKTSSTLYPDIYVFPVDLPNGNNEWPTIALIYHKSWDWLMPVIKKIREIINVELNIDSFEEIREQKLTLNPYDYDIEQVYKAVVEFIKWYNNND